MELRLKSLLWLGVFSLVWGGVFYLILFIPETRHQLQDFLQKHPTAAPILLIVAQVIFATFSLPCSPLTVIAGALWGVKIGMIYSTTATILASVCTFLISRKMFRLFPRVQSLATCHLATVRKLIERYSWYSVAIAHANPILPGSSLGYVFGLSSIPLSVFVFGVFVGTLPAQALLVFVGHIFDEIAYGEIVFVDLAITAIAVTAVLLLRHIVRKSSSPPN